jgi:hypothetical protein
VSLLNKGFKERNQSAHMLPELALHSPQYDMDLLLPGRTKELFSFLFPALSLTAPKFIWRLKKGKEWSGDHKKTAV